MTAVDCLGFGLLTYDRILLLDQFPERNQKLSTDLWVEQVGGPVATGLMCMAALGMRVQWGFPIAAGKYSEFVAAQFERLGIAHQFAEGNAEGLPIQEAVILVEKTTGARTVVLHDESTIRLECFDRIKAQLPLATWIYFDGRDLEFTLALKSWAKGRGSKLFLDMGSLRPSWEKVVEDCEVVIISDDVVRQMDGSLSLENALSLFVERGVRLTGVTSGDRGALFLHNGKFSFVQATTVDKVVDTTNAGDVYHGAFLAAWIKTEDLELSARFAADCAAWVVGEVGHNIVELPDELKQRFQREPNL